MLIMRSNIKAILVLVFLLAHNLCSAQSLTVAFTDVGKTKSYKISTTGCHDSLMIQKALNTCFIQLYRKGFLAATIDTFSCDSIKIFAKGRIGNQYQWANLIPDSSTATLINQVGIKVPKFSNKPANPKLLVRYISLTLSQLEYIGYPFARVKLDSVDIQKNEINALVNIDKGPRLTIDTIYLKGNARITPVKLGAIINLRKGELYCESKIKRIDQKLNLQPYLKVIKPSEIEFLNHKVRVYCYLNNRAASRFWGLAGFYSDKTDGKIKLNGDLNLSLVNSLKYGEKINFTWSAPGKGTQNLNLNADWPYIIGKQFGLNGSLSLFKHDSTYFTLNPKFSINFFADNGCRFMLNLDYKKTSYSSSGLIQQSQYGNTSAFLYGLGFEYISLDNLVLPNSGMFIKSNINTGTRNVNGSNNKTSNIIESELIVERFLSLIENRFILAMRFNSKICALYNTKENATLFENEMYRVGGLGTIRGFNQESVLSTAYSIATAEIHLRMSEGSGIYLFTDKAYIKTYELGYSINSWPLGLGLGLNLATKAGLFNLSYAVGKGFGQTLGLKDAKVHFGISTTF